MPIPVLTPFAPPGSSSQVMATALVGLLCVLMPAFCSIIPQTCNTNLSPIGQACTFSTECVNNAAYSRTGRTECIGTCKSVPYTSGGVCLDDRQCPPNNRCYKGNCQIFRPSGQLCPDACDSAEGLQYCPLCEDRYCFEKVCTESYSRGKPDTCANPEPSQPQPMHMCARGLKCKSEGLFSICTDGLTVNSTCTGLFDPACPDTSCWAPTGGTPPVCVHRGRLGQQCDPNGSLPTLCHWPLACLCGGQPGHQRCRCRPSQPNKRCRFGTDEVPCPASFYCSGTTGLCTPAVLPGGKCVSSKECLLAAYGCVSGSCGPTQSTANQHKAAGGCEYPLYWNTQQGLCTVHPPTCHIDRDCSFWLGYAFAACCNGQCYRRLPVGHSDCDSKAQAYDRFVQSGYKGKSEAVIKWELRRLEGEALCCFNDKNTNQNLTQPFSNLAACGNPQQHDMHITMTQTTKYPIARRSESAMSYFLKSWLETPGFGWELVFPNEWVTVHPLRLNAVSDIVTVKITLTVPKEYLEVAIAPAIIQREFATKLGSKDTASFNGTNTQFWEMYRAAYRLEDISDLSIVLQDSVPTVGIQSDYLPPTMGVPDIGRFCLPVKGMCHFCLSAPLQTLAGMCNLDSDCVNNNMVGHFGRQYCESNSQQTYCAALTFDVGSACRTELDCPPYSRCFPDVDEVATCQQWTKSGHNCPVQCNEGPCKLCEHNWCYLGVCVTPLTRGLGDACPSPSPDPQEEAPVSLCRQGLSCSQGTCHVQTIANCAHQHDPACSTPCVKPPGSNVWQCPRTRSPLGGQCNTDFSQLKLCLYPFFCVEDTTPSATTDFCKIPAAGDICRYGSDEVPCHPNFYCDVTSNTCKARLYPCTDASCQCTSDDQCFAGQYPGGCSSVIGRCGPQLITTPNTAADPGNGFFCKYPMWFDKTTNMCVSDPPTCTQAEDCVLFNDRGEGGKNAGCDCNKKVCVSRIGGSECSDAINKWEAKIESLVGGVVNSAEEAQWVWDHEAALYDAICCFAEKVDSIQQDIRDGQAYKQLQFCEGRSHQYDMVLSISTTAIESNFPASFGKSAVKEQIWKYMRTRTSSFTNIGFFPKSWLTDVLYTNAPTSDRIDFTTQVRVPARYIELVRSSAVFQRIFAHKLGGSDALGDISTRLPADNYHSIRAAWNFIDVAGIQVDYEAPERSCQARGEGPGLFALSGENESCTTDFDCSNGMATGHAGKLDCDEYGVDPVCKLQNYTHHSYCELEFDCPPFQRCHEGQCQDWVPHGSACPAACSPRRFGPTPKSYQCNLCEGFYCYGGYCLPPYERGINDTCPRYGDGGISCALGLDCVVQDLTTVAPVYVCKKSLNYGDMCNSEYDSRCPSGMCWKNTSQPVSNWVCIQRGALLHPCNVSSNVLCYHPLGCTPNLFDPSDFRCQLASDATRNTEGKIPCQWGSDRIPCPPGRWCDANGICEDKVKPGKPCVADDQCLYEPVCTAGKCGRFTDDKSCKVFNEALWNDPVTGLCVDNPPNCTIDNDCKYWSASAIPGLAGCNCATGKCEARVPLDLCQDKMADYEQYMSFLADPRVDEAEGLPTWNASLKRAAAICCFALNSTALGKNAAFTNALSSCTPGKYEQDMYVQIFHTMRVFPGWLQGSFFIRSVLLQWLETLTTQFYGAFIPAAWVVRPYEWTIDDDSSYITTRLQIMVPKRFLGVVASPTTLQKIFAMKLGAPDTTLVERENGSPDLAWWFMQRAFGFERVSSVMVSYGRKFSGGHRVQKPPRPSVSLVTNNCQTASQSCSACTSGNTGACSSDGDCVNSYIVDHTGHTVCVEGKCQTQNDYYNGLCVKQHDCPPFTRCQKTAHGNFCAQWRDTGNPCPCSPPTPGQTAYKCVQCQELWCYMGVCTSLFGRGEFDTCDPPDLTNPNKAIIPLCAPGLSCKYMSQKAPPNRICTRSGALQLGEQCSGPTDDSCAGYRCALTDKNTYKCVDRIPLFGKCNISNNTYCYWPFACNAVSQQCELLTQAAQQCRVGKEAAVCPPHHFCGKSNTCEKKVWPGGSCYTDHQCMLSHAAIGKCNNGVCGPKFIPSNSNDKPNPPKGFFCSYGQWVSLDRTTCTDTPPTCTSNTDCKFWDDANGGTLAGCSCQQGQSGTCVSRLPIAGLCQKQIEEYENIFSSPSTTHIEDEALLLWESSYSKYKALCCLVASPQQPTNNIALSKLPFCDDPSLRKEDELLAMSITLTTDTDHPTMKGTDYQQHQQQDMWTSLLKQWVNTPTNRYPHSHFPSSWLYDRRFEYTYESYADLINVDIAVQIPHKYIEMVYASSIVHKNFAIKLGSVDSYNISNNEADNDYIWLRRAWRIEDTSGIQFPKHNFWVPASPSAPPSQQAPQAPSLNSPHGPSIATPAEPGSKGYGWVVVIGILVVLGLIAGGLFVAYKKGYINIPAMLDKNYENVRESKP